MTTVKTEKIDMKYPEQISTNKAQAEAVIMPIPEESLKTVQDDVRFRLERMKVLFSEIQEIRKDASIMGKCTMYWKSE